MTISQKRFYLLKYETKKRRTNIETKANKKQLRQSQNQPQSTFLEPISLIFPPSFNCINYKYDTDKSGNFTYTRYVEKRKHCRCHLVPRIYVGTKIQCVCTSFKSPSSLASYTVKPVALFTYRNRDNAYTHSAIAVIYRREVHAQWFAPGIGS